MSTFPPADPPAEEEVAPDPPVPSGSTVVDSSVTQGNRLKTQAQLTPNNPVSILEAKIRQHFDAVSPLVNQMRSAADELEQLLNRLRVGF